MTAIPNTFVMTVVARQRSDELLAEADRYRLAKHAERTGAGRPRRSDWHAVALVVVALALLLAARAATDLDPSRQTWLSPGQAEGSVVSQVLDEHLLDPSAVQEVRAATV